MPRILAIDYGRKRVGLAVTDVLQIIATSLDTIPANKVLEYIGEYCKKETVERFVVGKPMNLDNKPAEAMQYVVPFVAKLEKKFPNIPVEWVDERFTSKIAFQSLIDSGVKKMARQDKSLVDKVSAVIILQTYLELKQNRELHESI